jgi:hypothetical protein
MTANTKNFNGQWVEIFAAGSQTDSEGRGHSISPAYLQQVVNNYSGGTHEAPAVLGHPEDNGPAYGWVSALRVNGNKLEAQFKDVDENFEAIVRDGKFKKRSASFYVDSESAPGKKAPYLRHVGFLGATPPAVKGLRDIQFSEGETLTFDSTINFSEDDMNQNDLETVTNSVWDKLKAFLIGGNNNHAASFSEADMTAKIAEAVKAVTTNFTEEIEKRDTQIAGLLKKVDGQTGATVRAQIESFVEKFGNDRLPPALRGGLVDFMEALAGSDQKITVVSFEESDGKKVEKKTETALLTYFKEFLESQKALIEFGEKFGFIKTQSDAAAISDPTNLAGLRAGMEIQTGGTK